MPGETQHVDLPDTPLAQPDNVPDAQRVTRALIITQEGTKPIPIEVFEERMEIIRPSIVSYFDIMKPGRADIANIILSLFEGFTFPLYNPESIEKLSPINSLFIKFLNDFKLLLEFPSRIESMNANFERLFANYRKAYMELQNVDQTAVNGDLELLTFFEKHLRRLMVSE